MGLETDIWAGSIILVDPAKKEQAINKIESTIRFIDSFWVELKADEFRSIDYF